MGAGTQLRRRLRRVPALIAAAVLSAVAMAGGPAADEARATEFGMSDGRSALFDAPHLHELAFTRVRLVLPWDAARRDGSWNEWLRRAELQGFPVLVAPTIDKPNRCDGGPCIAPSTAQYASALTELLDRYPGIEAVEAWNEPNHSSQPTAGNPALAAAYFNAAATVCTGRCTAVAGNLLDAASMPTYLGAYRAALQSKPAVWGIHDYYDATYFARGGLDQMLAVTDGPVWITEVGGLVSFQPPGASSGLPANESRAADSLRWMFTLAGRTPRLERMYLYGMWQEPFNAFDSALLRVDNSERESMAVARAYIGPRKAKLSGPEAPELPSTPEDSVGATTPSAHNQLPPPAKLGDVGRLRIEGKKIALRRGARRLTLRVVCVGVTACHGRVELRAPGWKHTRKVSVETGAGRTVRLHLPAKVVRALKPKTTKTAWVRVCDTGKSCRSGARIGLARR